MFEALRFLKARFTSLKYLRVEDENLISQVIDTVTDQISRNYGAVMKVTTRRVCSWLKEKDMEAHPVSVGRILAALHKLGFLEYAGRHGAYKVYFAKKDLWNPQAAYNMLRRKMLAAS